MAWQSGLVPPSLETAFGGPQNEEDWEDWLRWDPVAESSSPDPGYSNSGSSKNDSPIHVTAADMSFGGTQHMVTSEPPLIVGEHELDMAGNSILAFGTDGTNDFNFEPASHHFGGLPKQNFTDQDWAMAQPNDQAQNGLSNLQIPDSIRDNTFSGPLTATTPSFHNSPDSHTDKRTSVSSYPSPLPLKKRGGGRKRKAEVETDGDNENGNSEDGDGPPVKKTSHNVIEKRYRNNLNDKIVELRDSVPSLRALYKAKPGEASEDLEGLTAAHKHNKATIMAKATEYIRHLEKRNKTMQDEMDALKAKLASVENAFTRSRSRQGSITSPPPGTVRPREISSTTSPTMHSFLQIPQSQGAYQQQYMSQQTTPTYARPPNAPVDAQNTPAAQDGRGTITNKLMLAGMAGMMMMEGLANDQSGGDAHGLGMLPGITLLKRNHLDSLFGTTAATRYPALPLLKVFLVISVLLYLTVPFFTMSSRQKQPLRPVMRLPQAPSLASPVEVRRKAWLTAIQTVWVPKHFLLEVVSVLSKMFKMFLRRIYGMKIFGSFTDVNQDDEAARIKAWDIAIDAQLAGGDAEVSYYRLLLTLMASGTLPDSPTRLMQKAVHFRVFFWEVANAGYGNMTLFKQFTEKVGNFYWESARRQQKELLQARAANLPPDDNADPLPDHLASLLELDCDEVLSDEMIQRAWNLAWNKPSDNAVVSNAARSFVVLDHAIRSPLDAVAAWYSNMLIDETIAESFGSATSRIDMEYHLSLAISVAPPASSTQARALTTKAVLSRSNRHNNINAALSALPQTPSASQSMNLVAHEPASPEVRTALTMAKLMALSAQAPTIITARASVNEILSHFAIPPQAFTLLTAVGAYQLLQTYSNNKCLNLSAAQGLEDLACALRIWTGTLDGRHALEREERAVIVERCLEIAKSFGGWSDSDSGYASHAPSQEGSPTLGTLVNGSSEMTR